MIGHTASNEYGSTIAAIAMVASLISLATSLLAAAHAFINARRANRVLKRRAAHHATMRAHGKLDEIPKPHCASQD